jgi:hypothetical protein
MGIWSLEPRLSYVRPKNNMLPENSIQNFRGWKEKQNCVRVPIDFLNWLIPKCFVHLCNFKNYFKKIIIQKNNIKAWTLKEF